MVRRDPREAHQAELRATIRGGVVWSLKVGVRALCGWLLIAPSLGYSQSPSARLAAFDELTTGLDNEASFTAFAVAESDSTVAYLGTADGVI